MSDNDIPASDNFEPVPGVKYDDKPAEPAEPAKVEPAPEPTVEPEKTVEPAKPEAAPEPVKERPKKAGPIADLLSKKHELETQLETEKTARADLEVKLAELSQQQPSVKSDDDIKALAEEYGIDETLLNRIVNTARKGSELPQDVQDLLAERAVEKQQQAELEAFDKRLASLAKTLPDESLGDAKVREKLLALAYSTEAAPDGEPYFQKELSELYFGFIKPEIEPGKASAESSQGGTQATKVIDFEEIYTRDDPKDIDAMDSDTFNKYQTWVRENKESKTPLKRTG
jgi:pyruvate/2-oxoglutarate dehydrogenase complex dihydrolipoamide acyltransferase (E2) component